MARNLHWTSVAAIAAVLTVAGWDSHSAHAAGHWRTDYQQARADAEREGKLLLLHFHAKWCGPCRQMDREVLATPAMARALGENIIAVKVDSDLNQQLVGQLGIQALPSDVFMTPEGKVLMRTQGKQQAGNYLQMVSGMSSKFVRSRPVVAEQKPEPEKPATAEKPKPREDIIARVEPELPDEIADEAQPETDDFLGLQGFCPVTLWKSREWKPGRPEYSATYKGLTYRMYSAQALEEFQDDPRRFAPRLMGCDPVVMAQRNLANPGSTAYGAFYDGELYLFESDESRRLFKSDPERYSKIRQVQLPKFQSRLR